MSASNLSFLREVVAGLSCLVGFGLLHANAIFPATRAGSAEARSKVHPGTGSVFRAWGVRGLCLLLFAFAVVAWPRDLGADSALLAITIVAMTVASVIVVTVPFMRAKPWGSRRQNGLAPHRANVAGSPRASGAAPSVPVPRGTARKPSSVVGGDSERLHSSRLRFFQHEAVRMLLIFGGSLPLGVLLAAVVGLALPLADDLRFIVTTLATLPAWCAGACVLSVLLAPASPSVRRSSL